MNNQTPENHRQNNELKNFGLLTGSILLGIALWPLFYSLPARLWLAVPSVLIISSAIFFPPALKTPFHLWMKFGAVLGWINTRIILTLLYFLAILPIAVILKISGKTPLKLKFDPKADSYRETPEDASDNEFEQQF